MVEYSINLGGDFAIAFVDDVFYLLLSPFCETEVLFESDLLDHFLLSTLFFFFLSVSQRDIFMVIQKFLFHLSFSLFTFKISMYG